MSEVEKKSKRGSKKKKSKKKETVQEASSEVLERVMDNIEMAGASLDFFEQGDENIEHDPDKVKKEMPVKEPSNDKTPDEIEAPTYEDDPEPLEAPRKEDEESMDMSSDDDTESLEALSEDAQEESKNNSETYEDDSETLSLIEDENSPDFVEQTQAYSIIESLLFSSDRPIGLGTFKQVFKGTNYKTKEIKKALEEMKSEYADASRGVSLEEINGGWQLRTKVDNMDFMRKLAKARPFKLSGPALEVLSIIAYKQPIIKSEVDDIRGVESGHLVRALMERSLVSFQGKSELPGKPMQYGTTRKFLEIFGLRNLKELPSLDEIDQLLPDGIGMEEEDEKLSDVTESMSEDYQGNYSEGEEELEKIADTLGSIDTSSEFFEEEKQRQKEKRDRERAQDIREAMDVGEEVDDKDKRWLARYDEKMVAEAEAKANADAERIEATEENADFNEGEISDEDSNVLDFQPTELVAEEASIGDELSMLSEETQLEASSPETNEEDNWEEVAEEESSSDKELDPFSDEEFE